MTYSDRLKPVVSCPNCGGDTKPAKPDRGGYGIVAYGERECVRCGDRFCRPRSDKGTKRIPRNPIPPAAKAAGILGVI